MTANHRYWDIVTIEYFLLWSCTTLCSVCDRSIITWCLVNGLLLSVQTDQMPQKSNRTHVRSTITTTTSTRKAITINQMSSTPHNKNYNHWDYVKLSNALDRVKSVVYAEKV